MPEKIHYIRRNSSLYPQRFEGIADSPSALYYIGDLPDDSVPSVAIVGARSCSSYGRKTAFTLGRVMAENGIQVISGMAMGIDSTAQEGALSAGGKTYAVLGCGVDICYPRTSYAIYEALRKRGGILSEFEPGTPPLAHHFPQRNRIISALSDIVIVVEAREKSGSLITVDCALEQGRTVYAVPGRMGDKLSDGCNYLIAQGAGIVWSPEAVLDEIRGTVALNKAARLARTARRKMAERAPSGGRYHQLSLNLVGDLADRTVRENPSLSADAKALYQHIGSDALGADELSLRTGFPIQRVMSAVIELLMEGCVREVGKNLFVRA